MSGDLIAGAQSNTVRLQSDLSGADDRNLIAQNETGDETGRSTFVPADTALSKLPHETVVRTGGLIIPPYTQYYYFQEGAEPHLDWDRIDFARPWCFLELEKFTDGWRELPSGQISKSSMDLYTGVADKDGITWRPKDYFARRNSHTWSRAAFTGGPVKSIYCQKRGAEEMNAGEFRKVVGDQIGFLSEQ